MSAVPSGLDPAPDRARSALARIGLAATRLAREASTPAMQALVATITDAVEQLDRALGDALPPNGGALPRAPAAADVATTLDALRPRLVRALAARELGLDLAVPAAPVPGDASLLRQAVAQLVRGAARELAPGGRIVLGLRSEGSRFGVDATLYAADGRPATVDAARWLEAPRAFAQRWCGALEHAAGDDVHGATLWLPRELPACTVS